MSMSNLRFEIADQDYECNASLFVMDQLDELEPDLTEDELAAIERAKANNWKVMKGEQCRRYTWTHGDGEQIDCVEIPAIAEICREHDLWVE